MGLFKRMQDIISANLNEMVDHFEDPELMLREAVDEMEVAVSQSKPEVARAMAFEKMTKKELEENQAQAANWERRAESAIAAGDDDLARKAILRKRECEKIVAALSDQHAAALESSQTLRRQLEAMQAKLADAQRRLGTLIARRKAADVQVRMAEAKMTAGTTLSTDAFEKFERLSRKVSTAEAEAEAMSELAQAQLQMSKDGAVSSPAICGIDDEIEAEMMEMKRKVAGGR